MTPGPPSLKVRFWISKVLNVSVSDGSVEQQVGRRIVPSVSTLSVLIGQTATFTSDQTNGTRVQSVQASVWADWLALLFVPRPVLYCVSQAAQPPAGACVCVCVCVMSTCRFRSLWSPGEKNAAAARGREPFFGGDCRNSERENLL